VFGCQPVVTQDVPPASAAEAVPGDDALRQELDDVLRFTLHERRLSLRDHAAWQILHGALTYQTRFPVETEDGRTVSAAEHILHGGQMNGWTVETGIVLENADGSESRGLRAVVEPGSKTGQGHPDQWLAILAQCDLPSETPIVVGNQTFTMADFVSQVQYECPRNPGREWSWTLIGLSNYLPSDATWTAIDGEEWSIEKLVQLEAEQELDSSACGGTHRLIGMTMAIDRHLEQGGKLEGGWAEGQRVIDRAIRTAKDYQNPDGSFSSNYLSRPGHSADLANQLGTTGHMVEFLTLALPEEELHEPWMQRAIWNMCGLFRKTEKLPLECGALYHAAHGLALYRERVYGPHDWSEGLELDEVGGES